jgi:adenylate kinase
MNIVLLGPPGSGKGTQAEKICAHYRIPRISTGDLLRREVAEETALGKEGNAYMAKGLLVPDDIVNAIIRKRLESDDCMNGFLIDGYPRNVNQAIELESMREIGLVLYLELNLEKALERLEGRRSCPKCDAVYHLTFNPPKEKEVCDRCQTELVQRIDDKRDTITKRFETYQKETLPLFNYYDDAKTLSRINAEESIEDTFRQIQGILDSYLKK